LWSLACHARHQAGSIPVAGTLNIGPKLEGVAMEPTVEAVKRWLDEPDIVEDVPRNFFYPSFPHKAYKDKELMRILIESTCPIPCDGFSREPGSWHDLCIKKAIQAFLVLRGK
jgi:hypothetical protein